MVALRLDVETALQQAHSQGAISGEELMLLHLRYADGFTMDEIAELMGVNPATATRRLRRALEALRATGCLDGYLNE